MRTICKKDFNSILLRYYNSTDKIFFEKDKTYEFYHEDDGNTIWVIYNKKGGPSESGVRFHSEKRKEKVSAMHNFYHYFYSERAMKLKKLNGK